jgi:rhodanese-related sulfurtransferase
MSHVVLIAIAALAADLPPAQPFAPEPMECREAPVARTTCEAVPLHAWRAVTVPELLALQRRFPTLLLLETAPAPKGPRIPRARPFELAPGRPLDRRALGALDRVLVFYSAERDASDPQRAAERAVEAGYRHVFVLPGGLEAWRLAGQPAE